MIYFTADHHFNHGNIIKYCDRPFSSVKQMNRSMIKIYNEIVNDDDVVYILGDFTMLGPSYKGQIKKIVQKLQGTKHLILGNHDRLKPFAYEDIGFASVHTWLTVGEFTLVHDPAKSAMDRSINFLVGHIHDLFFKQKNCLNVGVDVWDFKPVSIDQVRKEFKQDKKQI